MRTFAPYSIISCSTVSDVRAVAMEPVNMEMMTMPVNVQMIENTFPASDTVKRSPYLDVNKQQSVTQSKEKQ